MLRRFLLLCFVLALPWVAESKLPDLTPTIVQNKLQEIMKAHATYKQLTPELVKRALQNYLEELDPNKSYFIESDIDQWLNPSDALLQQILEEYKEGNFQVFAQIHEAMIKAIKRRHELENKIDITALPKHVNPEEFKDMKWVKTEDELLNRISRIKALQIETSAKLSDDVKDKALQRIAKSQAKFEEEILNPDPVQRQRLILSNILKATASALDAHTAYFTPDEAEQFMINVQQRLFGIGAQLRDDINGFTVTKIIEGGPAALGKELKVKDRIIAVNGEPVVGMDIRDAVELIRGEENTPVVLTVIREVPEKENGPEKEEKLNITIKRGEVVLKETRYETLIEPYGDGIIGYLRLYSFYQDPESSSGTDLANEIQKLKDNHHLEGIILDLRYNSGGMLSQAVSVTSLFITKGTVVSIKDETSTIQHLRDLEGKADWDGPLIVLINRASASASEIVAGTLQDYGRALIVGDDHTYGKGSYQTFTLSNSNGPVNPQGEYKVTRGIYYTVSGRSPQLTGVPSDIVVPGMLSEMEIGEKYGKYPLPNDFIKPNFDDDLADIPYGKREQIRLLYKFDLQKQLHTYEPFLATLRKNSAYRIEHNKEYQNLLKELKKKETSEEVEENQENLGVNDFQLNETYNIMRDLIFLMEMPHKPQ